MNTDFAPGDVVKLKSGGHEMTVQGLEKPNGDIINAPEDGFRVRTAWMDSAGKMMTSHGLLPNMLISVKKAPREEHDDKTYTDGVSRAISRQDRPLSPMVQSEHPETVHGDDNKSQSLGNEAERQPAQETEVDHAQLTDDPADDIGTVHEAGKTYPSSRTLKDNR